MARRSLMAALGAMTLVAMSGAVVAGAVAAPGTGYIHAAPLASRAAIPDQRAASRRAAVTVVRLVAGHHRVTAADGTVWSPDAGIARGGHVASLHPRTSPRHFERLSHRVRYGVRGYHLTVAAPGRYRVTIGEVERPSSRRGRWFGLSMNGGAGHAITGEPRRRDTPFARSLTGVVLGHRIDLRFAPHRQSTAIAWLMVVELPASSPAHRPAPISSPTSTPAPTATPTSTPTAAPTSSGAAPAPTPTASPATVLTPEDFGAVGDGRTDDTAALQRFLDAGGPGVTLQLTPGRSYVHTAVLDISQVGTHLTGDGVLLATREATSSVWVAANNVTIDGGVTMRTVNTSQRWGAWEQMGLRVEAVSDTTLSNVTIDGSAAAGLYIGGAQHFTLDHVHVENTRADGIHMTEGAAFGTVISPTVTNTGDDGIAVVSYQSDGAPCHDISVTGAVVNGTTWGRGMSVVGGTDITYRNFTVTDSDAAGLYIAAEGSPWYTAAPTDIVASNGTLTDSNTDSSVDHGAVLVLSGESDVAPTNVTIGHLTIVDTRPTASRDVGVINYGLAPSAIAFDDIAITGGPSAAYQGNSPASSYTTDDWTQNGVALPNHG